jgi:cytosine/adenosine deaminase-related metal-dependent hydrolase
VAFTRFLSLWSGLTATLVILIPPGLHAQSSPPSAIAIVGARILDGSGNEPFEGTVVVRGDRVAEVGRSVKPPEGALIIDAQGRTVLPGLIDLAVELPRSATDAALTRVLGAYLYAGVTSIVPANATAADIDGLRTRILRTGIKSPRLVIAAAEDRLARGSASGGVLPDAQIFADWRQRNVTYVPELAAAAPADRRGATALLKELGGANAPGAATAAVANQAGGATTDAATVTADPAGWKTLLDQTRAARDAGVRLGVGSRAGAGAAPAAAPATSSGDAASALPHGWSTLLAMRLLTEASVTPLQAVTAATSGGAWALGVQSDRGFLAVGQRADLIVVRGDPAGSIGDIERIERVFLGGEEIDRAGLRALIAPAAGAPSSPETTASAPLEVPAAAGRGAGSVVAMEALVDDFERNGESSELGESWASASESSSGNTTVVAGRVVRGLRDHALHVTARMGSARDAHARVTVRVAQKGRPLDVSRFNGLRFDARGQGRYRVTFVSRSVSDGRYHESYFSGSPFWTPVSIPFASIGQTGKGKRVPWTGRELVEIVFQIARDPGDLGWLELDNIRFY